MHTAARGVLEGVSRRTAIEFCQRFEIPLHVEPLPVALLREADEVFLTSSGGGVLPIARIDGQRLPSFPGPVTTRIYEGYWAMHNETAFNDPVDYSA